VVPIQPLVLWDIDGTILDTRGAGVAPLSRAMSAVLDQSVSFERGMYSGLSDFEIIESVSRKHGIRNLTSEMVSGILELYSKSLREALALMPPKILAESQESLAFMQENDMFLTGILSGNWRQGGEIKLASTQLLNFFLPENLYFADFELKTRIEVLGYALKNHENIILIGDTPNDINAGRAFSVPVVSVATGLFSWETLEELNPGRVLPSNWTRDDLVSLITELI